MATAKIFRISDYTEAQIQELTKRFNMTRSTLLALAVDQFYRAEIESKRLSPPHMPNEKVVQVK